MMSTVTNGYRTGTRLLTNAMRERLGQLLSILCSSLWDFSIQTGEPNIHFKKMSLWALVLN